MPQFQVMIERANEKFACSKPKPPSGAFPRDTELGVVLAAPALSIAQNQSEQDTADIMPKILQEALKGAMYAAVQEPCGVQFIWLESPDWGLEISYASSANGSPVSVSVIIRSPKNPAGIKPAAS